MTIDRVCPLSYSKSMIVYEPLARSLREKGMTFDELAVSIGEKEDCLRNRINNGEYIPMRIIDRICSTLSVSVENVVKWKEGKQNPGKRDYRTEPDWSRIEGKAAERGHTLYSLAKACGLNESTLYKSRERKTGRMSSVMMRKICGVLECTKEELCK